MEYDIHCNLKLVRTMYTTICFRNRLKSQHSFFQCCQLVCFLHIHGMHFSSTPKCPPSSPNCEFSSTPMSWSGRCSDTPMSRSGGSSSNSSSSARSHVHFEINRSCAAFSTLIAVECWTTRVDASDMSIQVWSFRKRAVTEMTLVMIRSSVFSSSSRFRFDRNIWMPFLHVSHEITSMRVHTWTACASKTGHHSQFSISRSEGA